jgi:hypothetical protein
LSHWSLPNCSASCYALGIFKKLSMSRVHWLGLKLFGVIVWKLFIIESFFQWKLITSKLKIVLEIGGIPGVGGKCLANQIYFTILRAKVWKMLIFNGFCCYEFKQIAKIEFGKKIQLNFQCVHTWANATCYINNN